MSRFSLVKIFVLMLALPILISCNSSNTNSISKKEVVNSTNTSKEPASSSEAQVSSKELRISYLKSKEVNSNKDTQTRIDKINQLQYDIAVAICEATNSKCSFNTYSSDNDVLTSVERRDSDTAFGFNFESDLQSNFEFSYSYLYVIINFSSFDYKGHHSFVVAKGDTEVLNILNDGINTIKENGVYFEIYRKHFPDDNSMSIL
ncbi:transporter substrate-binding domain-containing protein [Paenibacillus sp. GCM10027627]|uniref:transporter substrate-binding domain-containing protein n=1 Tax=unclassified Paenibacillus TaxID=185978 RepID=UPI00363938B1